MNMIRVAFFFLLMGSFPGFLNAQIPCPFPQPGLQQTQIYFGDWTELGYPHNNSFYYASDTTVSTYTYAKFLRYDYGMYFYTFYDTGKVYYLPYYMSLSNPYAGELIYDFSMPVGDSIFLDSYLHYGYYKVNGIDTLMMLNGQNRRHFVLNQGTDTVEWIDGIGDIEGGITYEGDFEGGYEYFVCHSDSSGPIYVRPSSAFMCDPLSPMYETGTVTCGPFTYDLAVNTALCDFANDGSIVISGVTGGTPGYTYSIDGGATFAASGTFNSLYTGTYEVIVQDAMGNSCPVTVFVPSNGMSMSLTQTDASCSTACDATVALNATGGSLPYLASMDGGPGGSLTYTNVCPGTHEFCIYESAWGCAVCTTIVIGTTGVDFSVTSNITPPSCDTCCDGDLQATLPSGGTPPYSVVVDPAYAPNNFCEGVYVIYISDASGCTDTDTVTLDWTMSTAELKASAIPTIFPNPSVGQFTVQFKEKTSCAMQVVNSIGKTVMHSFKTNENSVQLDLTNKAPGVYFLWITVDEKKSVYKLVLE